MPLADYQITVIDTTGASVFVYDGAGIYECRYARTLNDVGALALVVPDADDLASRFGLDYMVEVQRRSPLTGLLAVEDTYFVRLTQRFREGDEQRFVVGGMSLNHLLARRVVDPDDDAAQAGGYSTKAGAADDVMIAYVREQCGDLCLTAARQFPNFSVAGSLSIGRSLGQRLRHENLLDVMQTMAEQGKVDFNVRRVTGNTLRLDVAPIGTNKTKTYNYPSNPFVLITPQRGNLDQPSLTFDRKGERSFVYMKGQGQGKNRKLLKVAGTTAFDSPYNRIEFAADARNADKASALQLLTESRSELNKARPVRAFSFEPTGSEPGLVYRNDFDLGDQVTVIWDDYEVDLRITAVEVSLSASEETLKITVAEVLK
jgi:hypothetical protein